MYKKFGFGALLFSLVLSGCASTADPPSRASNTLSTSQIKTSPTNQTSSASSSSTGKSLHVTSDAAWTATKSGIRIRNGLGQWQLVALTNGLKGTDVNAALAGHDGSIVVASLSGTRLKLLVRRRGSSSWRANAFVIKQTAGSSRPRVLILQGTKGVLVVSVVSQVSDVIATEQAFVSVNDGGTFHPTRSMNGPVWHDLLFSSTQNGVAIQGPAANRVAYTIDGGTTWILSKIASFGTTPDVTFSGLLSFGADKLGLFGSADTDNGSQLLSYVSTDGGVTFQSVAAVPPTLPARQGSGTVLMAAFGQTIWAIPSSGTVVWKSQDGGANWEQIPAVGLEPNADQLAITSSASATVHSDTTKCDNKTACQSSSADVVTTDGGSEWTPA